MLLASIVMVFIACSARIDGVVREGGAGDLTLKASLAPRTSALIRSLRSFMGDDSNMPVLDGKAIGQSMAVMPGMKAVALSNTSPEALEGSIVVANLGDFLASGNTKGRLVTYAEKKESGASSITITLDRSSIPEFVKRLSPEVEDYLSALMVPVILGETMSAKEYLDLVASVYGRPLADEIAAAQIHSYIEFPRPVTFVRGGNAAGKQAQFDIPLLDIFVLEQPLSYQVNW